MHNEKKISVDDLKKLINNCEKKQFSLPLKKRLVLAFFNFKTDWKIREYYKPLWWIKSIADEFKLVFKIRR